MKKNKEQTSFATEIIAEMKRQRDIWRIAAVISIALNIIQWLFQGYVLYELGNGAPTPKSGGIQGMLTKT